MKRPPAYSSIAQAGYMLIGLVAGRRSPGRFEGGGRHSDPYLFAYLFTNLGVFAVVIILAEQIGHGQYR